jgi:hypothetical protein
LCGGRARNREQRDDNRSRDPERHVSLSTVALTVATASWPLQQRSVFVGCDTQLPHRLAEAEGGVACHLGLQINERNVMVGRLLQGGDELSLITEPAGRLLERHTGWEHRLEASPQLRIHVLDEGGAILPAGTASPAASCQPILVAVGTAPTTATRVAATVTGIFWRIARVSASAATIAPTASAATRVAATVTGIF